MKSLMMLLGLLMLFFAINASALCDTIMLPSDAGYSDYMEQSSKQLQCAMKGYTDDVRCDIWWQNLGQ